MDRQEILDEVIEFIQPPRIQSNEFTIAQFVARHEQLFGSSLSVGQLRRRLNGCVADGTMGKRKVLLEGYITNVYHLIKEDENGRARRSHEVSETTGEGV